MVKKAPDPGSGTATLLSRDLIANLSLSFAGSPEHRHTPSPVGLHVVSTTAAPQPAHHFPAEFLPPARSESLAFHLPAASAPPAFILNRRESIDAVIQAELAADRNEDDGEDMDEDEEYDDIGPEVYYARQNLPSYLQQRVTASSPACQAAKSRSGPLKQHQATAAPPLQTNNLLPPPPPPPAAMHSSDSITRTVSSAATHAQPTLLPQLLAAAPLNSAVCGTARLSGCGGEVAPLPPANHHHHHERMVPAAAATATGHHHNQMSGPPPPSSLFPSGGPENQSNGGHHRGDENSAPAATAAATLSHLMLGQIKVRGDSL